MNRGTAPMRALLPALFLCVLPALAAADETLLLQDPTVSAAHVVFVYAEDLWVAPRTGGDARRLTSSSGAEFAPRLSPDGRLVAFSGQYEGNTDVYVIPIEGGTPERLTWHPDGDVAVDWHPDGRRILFRSTRASGARVARLFLVRADGGGNPVMLPIPKAFHAAYNADASRLAYTPIFDAFRTWKRHRGGTVPPVWIYDEETHAVEEVPHGRATDTFPCWLDGAVYFASDRDGHMNLWHYRPGSGQVDQITHFTDFDIRNMDAGGGVVVFEQAGALHLFDPQTRSCERLEIRVRADGLAALPRWQPVGRSVRAAAIAPNGMRAVFEARGEIITVPREHGDARNLTNSPGAHDRSPAWSPDGKQVAWFSDESGEYQLLVRDRKGREQVTAYDFGGAGFYYDPVWSPDGKHLLCSDKAGRLAYVTLETARVTEVARVQGSLGVVRPKAVWSPDSKWIAFENRNPRTMYDHIALFELETGAQNSLTDDFGAAGEPAFSADGKYLFFTASVSAGPKLFGLDMSSSAARPADSSLYVAVLKKDTRNPLAPKSDEAEAAEPKKEKEKKEKPSPGDGKDSPEQAARASADQKKPAPAEGAAAAGTAAEPEKSDEKAEPEKPEEKAVPSIDLDGIDQRILALPIGSGSYFGLACTRDKLLLIRVPQSGPPELMSFDFESKQLKSLAPAVFGFLVSADGNSLLVNASGSWTIQNAAAKDAKRLAIDSVNVRVDPAVEWPQILREVWRIQRDYFYDQNMHHVDWPAMWKRWSAFLPHVRHRADLNMIISELIGELCCGHQYNGGGDAPRAPGGVAVGLLGADWNVARQRYQIARIYRGQNWNPGLRAPLTGPGIEAREGDYLITVDGRPVMADENLYRAFENTAGRQVEITLASAPDGIDARTMTVVPVSSERGLRFLSWIEENRRRVDELSGGRLAYIYMPDTAGSGMAAFDRDFYSQLDRDGVILDERYNGGGQVADYIIDTLSRRVISYWMNREQWLAQSPFGTIAGPKVMIINESAGSGGDWMPWAFQRCGIGPLVGTRTWGGLVGISGYPPLMDGGMVTSASFGVMDPDGNWAVENVGVSPDYEVIEWPADIIAGRDPQLEKAVELALAELKRSPPRERPRHRPPVAR